MHTRRGDGGGGGGVIGGGEVSFTYRVLGGPQGDVHDGPLLGVVDLLPAEHGRALSGDVGRLGKVEEHVLVGDGEGKGRGGEGRERESRTAELIETRTFNRPSSIRNQA